MDQSDPWQAVPRLVFTHCDSLLISVAFIVLCRVGCLGVPSVIKLPTMLNIAASNVPSLKGRSGNLARVATSLILSFSFAKSSSS